MAQTKLTRSLWIRTEETLRICECCVGFNGHKDPTSRDEAIALNAEQDANARLIAAAASDV